MEMAEPEDAARDDKGRFLTGSKPGPGRPRGARSRLGEHFIEALANDFEEHGIETIEKVRVREPGTYIKVIKDILPREVLVRAFSVEATVDLTSMAETQGRLAAYRFTRDMIGAEPLDVDEGVLVTESWRHDHD
jgi:hypothetical protein